MNKQPGIGTREPVRKQPGSGTPGPMKQEHSQQQAKDDEFTKQPSVTKQRVGADVPGDVPQSEIIPKVQEGPKSQLSISGIRKRKVQNMMVRISSQ